MELEEWLGKENQLGIDIWNKKYKDGEENFEQWLGRISDGNEEIAQLIREKKFLFGGRILSNRGLENHGRKVKSCSAFKGRGRRVHRLPYPLWISSESKNKRIFL